MHTIKKIKWLKRELRLYQGKFSEIELIIDHITFPIIISDMVLHTGKILLVVFDPGERYSDEIVIRSWETQYHDQI
jgi:hypothetical protein